MRKHTLQVSASTGLTYVERVNRAIDHVLAHLAGPVRLSDVARAAFLSPYHFHRIFHALTGQTVADFVRRARLERALSLMAFGGRRSLTEIALECGFTSSSDFSRAFRRHYGCSPRSFDLTAWRARHRADLVNTQELPRLGRLPPAAQRGFPVHVRDLPRRTVAYIRVNHPYREGAVPAAARRLVSWAAAHGVDGQWLGYQYENPELVALEACRYHVAVEVKTAIAHGEIGVFTFPPMTVAEVEVRGSVELELEVLQWLYGTWLPRSRFVPDDQPAFEAWVGRPFQHGPGHVELYAQLPVRRR